MKRNFLPLQSVEICEPKIGEAKLWISVDNHFVTPAKRTKPMKLKPILTAVAVAVSAVAQPAMACFTQNDKGEVTHYNGIPLPPIQSVEQAKAQSQKEIAAAKKAREAQQAEQPATRHSSPATPPQEVFFTGKPYLEETGQYLFLFRHYDPELARWTTADPSGFPDGANNIAYMAVPTSEFDWQGLESKDIHADFGFELPVIGSWAVGAWDGAFVWSFAKGSEMARVETSPGFSGFTGIPLSWDIGPTNVGVGFRTDPHVINKSAYSTKMEGGVQWRRWIVDLEVKWDSTLTIGVDISTKQMGSEKLYIEGNWYE
jgi:RHS repeat-associated protein